MFVRIQGTRQTALQRLGNVSLNAPFLLNTLLDELNSMLVMWWLQKLGMD